MLLRPLGSATRLKIDTACPTSLRVPVGLGDARWSGGGDGSGDGALFPHRGGCATRLVIHSALSGGSATAAAATLEGAGGGGRGTEAPAAVAAAAVVEASAASVRGGWSAPDPDGATAKHLPGVAGVASPG